MNELVAEAKKRRDGHLTILKFTTNWRVDFGTLDFGADDYFETYDLILNMPVGRTFEEAAANALAGKRPPYRSIRAEIDAMPTPPLDELAAFIHSMRTH
jgi:hypothetical protein